MRESKVEQHLKTEVARAGGLTRKFKSPGRKNVPDQIVIWPHVKSIGPGGLHECRLNHIQFVECKRPGKDATAAQAREHVRLQKLGCVVLVIDTIEKVDNYVARMK